MCVNIEGTIFCRQCGETLEEVTIKVECTTPAAVDANGVHSSGQAERTLAINRCPSCQLIEEHVDDFSMQKYRERMTQLRKELRGIIEVWADGIKALGML